MSENGDDKSQQSRRRVISSGAYTRKRNNNFNSNNNNNRNYKINNNRGRNNNNNIINEKELATQLIQIQSKRFYIDVKENDRGRFIKLAEVGVGGRKSRILLTCGAAVEFNELLGKFVDFNENLPEVENSEKTKVEDAQKDEAKQSPAEGALKSETLTKEKKRYYLDLKENDRGRFLRVAMVVSRGPRAQIAVPAQGLKEFRDHLAEILDKYNDGTGLEDSASGGNGEQNINKPAALQFTNANSKSLKASNKTFYFDLGSNVHGSFLKINEVRANQFRTNITIPVKFIEAFRDQLNLVLEEQVTIDALNDAANDNQDDQSKNSSTTDLNESKA